MKMSLTMFLHSETVAVVTIKDFLRESTQKYMKTGLGVKRKVKWE